MTERQANKLLIWFGIIFFIGMWWGPFWRGVGNAGKERAASQAASERATLAQLPTGCSLTNLGPYRAARELYVVTCDGRSTQTQTSVESGKHSSQSVDVVIEPPQ